MEKNNEKFDPELFKVFQESEKSKEADLEKLKGKLEKKYPIGDMVLPADKIAFMLKSIEELKADNKSDHDAGEFDSFNHRQQGRYKALEEVLQWLNPQAPTAPSPDELWDEFSEATDHGIVMSKEGWRKVVERMKII